LLRLAAAFGLVLALGGYGPWLPPLWMWLLTLVALHVVDAAAARSQAGWEWRRGLDWLRLHGFAIGLGSIVLMGICVRLSGVGRDLGHTPVDVDEYRLATTVLDFFRTGEVNHSTVENYPGILFWLLAGVYLFIYLAALVEGVARDLQSMPLELFVLGGRVANIMLAAGTTAFTGLLARMFGGRRAGLVAALTVAVTPLSVETSGQLRNEAAQSLLIVLAVWAAVRLADPALAEIAAESTTNRPSRQSWYAILAGGMAGAATAVKYSSVFALFPGLLAAALPPATAMPGAEFPWRETGRRLGLLLLAFFAILVTTNHFLWADLPNFVRQLSIEVAMSGEHHWSAQKNPGWYYSKTLGRQGPGWALLVLASGYAAWGLATRRALPLILVAFPLSYTCFMTQRPAQFPRWVYPLAPFVAVAGATALWAIFDRVRQWLSGTTCAPRSPWLMTAALLTLALVQPLWAGAVLLSRQFTTPTYGLVESWLREHAAAGDRVLLPEGWLDLKGTALHVNRVPRLGAVLNGGIYPLCYNNWVVVPEPYMRPRSLEHLRPAETFLADYSLGGNSGFDFAVYTVPRPQPVQETVDFELDRDEARSYLGTDWPLPEQGTGGRRLPSDGASVYLPPLAYAAERLNIQLETAVPEREGTTRATAPGESPSAPIKVSLEEKPLLADKVLKSGSRISWLSGSIQELLLGRGVVQVRLTPLAESATIHVLRFAVQRATSQELAHPNAAR
jgi:4-amino-4-deoxy-L-arabinose transferase-like glycosyltransferase